VVAVRTRRNATMLGAWGNPDHDEYSADSSFDNPALAAAARRIH